MQKIKFQIKGMHCQSCATLIEEGLKDLDGVVSARVSFDSQKAVVVYNEEKLDESAIQETIKDVGDYTVEKIEEAEEPENDNVPFSEKQQTIGSQSEILNRLRIITGLVIISLGLNIFLAITLFSQLPKKELQKAQTSQALQPQDNQADNSLKQQPSLQNDNQNQPIATFNIDQNDRIRGNFDAPITLVEFSDFECPFCERHYPTLNKILNDYSGKVRLVYKHFPLGFHPNAQKAAEASECADEQGKFWEYHDKLFENLDTGYSTENFKKWAKDLGLNSGKFNDCLDSGKFAQKVQNDYQEGIGKGVNGTPATFINGQLVSGALPYEAFKQIIDSLLTQAAVKGGEE